MILYFNVKCKGAESGAGAGQPHYTTLASSVQSPGTMGPWLLSEAGDRDGAGGRWKNNVLIRKVSTKYRGNFCIHGLSTLYLDACQQNHQ